MTHRPPTFLRAAREQGFSIVAAVFMLVVLAGLAGFIVSVSGGQQLALAQDVMAARARQASRAGVEWATYQVAKVPAAAGNFTALCEASPLAAPGGPSVLAGLPGLADFRIELSCGSAAYSEADAYRLYRVTATACNAATCGSAPVVAAGYVEHQQVAVIKVP